MEKTHIVLLVLIAAAACIIVSRFGYFRTYTAFAYASKRPGKQCYVIGFLAKGRSWENEPVNERSHFSFYENDKTGGIRKVIFSGTKPQI